MGLSERIRENEGSHEVKVSIGGMVEYRRGFRDFISD